MHVLLALAFATAGLAVGCLVVPAAAGPESQLAYFGATTGPESAPESSACVWVNGTFDTFAGVPVPVRVTSGPVGEVDFDEVVAVEIHEAIPAPSLTGSRSYVFAQLVVGEDTWRRIRSSNTAECGTSLLVRHEGRDIDLVPIASISREQLPGGSFTSRREAEEFYYSLADRMSHVELSDEKRRYWEVQNELLLGIAVWCAKCDPSYLRRLGDGLYERIIENPELRAESEQADCDVDPRGAARQDRD